MAAPGMIEIPLEDFDQLCKDSFWLGCLVEAGVDNWEGMIEAHRILQESEEAEAASLTQQDM